MGRGSRLDRLRTMDLSDKPVSAALVETAAIALDWMGSDPPHARDCSGAGDGCCITDSFKARWDLALRELVAHAALPVGQTIPSDYTFVNIGTCRSCGAGVAWCLTPSKRKAPLNADGTSHFSTCPEADRFRRNHG